MQLFETMSYNFKLSANGVWAWYRKQYFATKVLALIWAVIASIILTSISWIFKIGIIFDFLASWLQKGRNKVISRLDRWANDLKWKKFAYFTVPIKIVLLLPLALLLGILPKFSTEVDVVGADNDKVDINHGFFFKVAVAYLVIAKSLIFSSFKHGILFIPIGLLISFYIVPMAILIALFFFIFILLDLLGWIIEVIRNLVLSSSYNLAKNTGNNTFTVILLPSLLIILFPIYILLILIPKISSYDSNS